MAKKILVAPLDWGLGHATRCVPIIDALIAADNQVTLASASAAAEFLHERYPQLPLLRDIPAYNMRYPAHGSMIFTMIAQAPRVLGVIRNERQWLKEAIAKHRFDEVISDNRYGLYNDTVKCSLITHQLFVRGPRWATPALVAMVNKYASRFHECLVPDFEDENNLSGELSHGPTNLTNIRFIGPLSRFAKSPTNSTYQMKYHALAIISGPEPQRAIFQSLVENVFLKTGKKCAMICGIPQKSEMTANGDIDIFSHADDSLFTQLIHSSKNIVCRSGYSTLMDLHVLNRSALLVPTPGQTEQEYLAEYHTNKGRHKMLTQSEFTEKWSSVIQ